MQINTGYTRKINKHQEAKGTIVDKLYFCILTKQSAGKRCRSPSVLLGLGAEPGPGGPKDPITHATTPGGEGGRPSDKEHQFKAGQLQFPEL